MVLCWQHNLVFALGGLIKARAGCEGDGFLLRAGTVSDELEGAFFSNSEFAVNSVMIWPGFTLTPAAR